MGLTGPVGEEITGTISNDGFFPDIKLEDFKANYNLPDQATLAMVKRQVLLSMFHVNNQLAAYKESRSENSLADVPSISLEQISMLVISYDSAVYHRAKAYLLDELKTVVRKDIAENLGKDILETRNALIKSSNVSVRLIKGLSRTGYQLL